MRRVILVLQEEKDRDDRLSEERALRSLRKVGKMSVTRTIVGKRVTYRVTDEVRIKCSVCGYLGPLTNLKVGNKVYCSRKCESIDMDALSA